MFGDKKKAFTLSYDDGVTQDVRLIALLDKYSLKATFNLNSGLLGKPGELNNGRVTVTHNKVLPGEVASIYSGHEVAVHTLTHPNLRKLTDDEVVRQVEGDRSALEALVGYPVVGMAYPCGGQNNDDRVAGVIRGRTAIKYARTIDENGSFALQDNLYRFNPTVHHTDFAHLFKFAEDFIAYDGDEPAIFYVWGHSYEFDFDDSWDEFERFCAMISGRDDIFYGTNREVLL